MKTRTAHLPILSPDQRDRVLHGAVNLPILRQRLAAQHPVHEEFAKAYDNLGGTIGLTDWAQQHPTEFYKLFKAMAPTPQPVVHSGEVKLTLSLAPNPSLDEDYSQTIDQVPDQEPEDETPP